MNWNDYMKSVAGSDKNAAIGFKIGVSEATVSRWKKSGPRPENVAEFARAYGRPVLEAFVAAGFLTPEEAQETPTAAPNLSQLTNDELLTEIRKRMGASNEQEPRSETPSTQHERANRHEDGSETHWTAASMMHESLRKQFPGLIVVDTSHFHDNAAVNHETIDHFPDTLEGTDLDAAAYSTRYPSEGRAQKREAEQRGEESQDPGDHQ